MLKTSPELTWMAWSGFGQMYLLWKQAGVQESLGHGFWQDATGLLSVAHLHTQLRSSTDVLYHVVQTQPGSSLVLADCVRFCPNRPGPEASWCARTIQLASGQRFRACPNRMQIKCGMFAGTAREKWYSSNNIRNRFVGAVLPLLLVCPEVTLSG